MLWWLQLHKEEAVQAEQQALVNALEAQEQAHADVLHERGVECALQFEELDSKLQSLVGLDVVQAHKSMLQADDMCPTTFSG